MTMITIHPKIKKELDDAFANNKQMLIIGGRNFGRRLIQNYIFTKQFPKGKVVIVSKEGIRTMEDADAVEIK